MSDNPLKQRLEEYKYLVQTAIDEFDFAVLESATELVRKTYHADRQIFTIGNGGSAAVAVHLAADFGKNIAKTGEKFPRIMTLCANSSSITALGNDCGYEETFTGQLRNFFNSGDLLIAISSSGNSPNIIRAAEYARANGGKVVGMSGFDGGKLKHIADISLHVPAHVYEVVEDVHSVFCHAIIHALKSR
ncbi:MAG: SIS domain-containing protein [Planctomycetaceae bacterium]|jgi:D-sedoheptulose 7-phosphate isomerase|nr:SIS domain-containing protein [Planctomycetaceae bacterium]